MNNINVTVELCKEDRIRLDTIITALGIITGQLDKTPAPTEDEVIYVPDTVAETPAEAPQEPEIVQDEPVEVKDEAPAPTVTKQDILQKVIALCGKGKKAEAKDVITTYADSVSDLPDSALVEVWDKLTALEV